MGLFDGMLGNASECSNEEAFEKYSCLLAKNEKIENAYKIVRDHGILFSGIKYHGIIKK